MTLSSFSLPILSFRYFVLLTCKLVKAVQSGKYDQPGPPGKAWSSWQSVVHLAKPGQPGQREKAGIKLVSLLKLGRSAKACSAPG